jgi:hypothetical protein
VAKLAGGCHCGNITVRVELERAPEGYAPRACDCEFCRKHGAAWVSDPRGSLSIHIRDERDASRYAQGDRLAEMLVCRNCGVLVSALWRHERLYGVVNASVLDVAFAAVQPVSPRTLSAQAKMSRWQSIWFADVALVMGAAGGEAGGEA